MSIIRKFQFNNQTAAKSFLMDVENNFSLFFQKFDNATFPQKMKNPATFWTAVGEFLTGNSIYRLSIDKTINLHAEIPLFTNKGFLYKKVYLYSEGSNKVENSFEFHNIEQLVKVIILDNTTDDKEVILNKILSYGIIIEIPEKRGTGNHYHKPAQSNPFEFQHESLLPKNTNEPNNQILLSKEDSEKIKKLIKDLEAYEWSMYYFWEQKQESDDNSGHKTYGIKQSLVVFHEGSINIADTEYPGQNLYYNGKYNIVLKGNQFYVETDALTIKGGSANRYLRIILYFGDKGIDEISLGVYYNTRSQGALYSGTVIMLKMSDLSSKSYRRLKKEYCIVHTDWSEFDEPIIKNYFDRRDLNLIKIPNIRTKYNQDELSRALETLKEKRNIDVRLFKYNCFFSIPLTFDVGGNDCYVQNRNLALKIEKLLIENKLIKSENYLACRIYKTRQSFEVQSRTGIVTHTLDSVAKSQYFVLIYPKMSYPENNAVSQTSISFAIVEIGYALGLGKKVIIFCESNEKEHLPKGLLALDNESVFILTFEMKNINGLVKDFNLSQLKKVFF